MPQLNIYPYESVSVRAQQSVLGRALYVPASAGQEVSALQAGNEGLAGELEGGRAPLTGQGPVSET